MLMTYGKQAKRVYVEWEKKPWGLESEIGTIQEDDTKGYWLFMKGANTAHRYRKLKRAQTAALNKIRAHFKNGL